MKNTFLLLAFSIVVLFSGCSDSESKETKVLVFTKTTGYKHRAIPNGIDAIYKLGLENNFKVDTTSNSAFFRQDTLQKYASIIFLSTTGDVVN